MKTIYKYALKQTDRQTLPMPDARILSVGEQGGGLFLWAVVDTDATPHVRHFRIFGTGHPFDGETRHFIGTVKMSSGLVWHVFEDVE